MEMDGQRISGGGAQIVVRGKRFTTIAMGATYEGTVTIHQTTAPKRFELHFEEGPEKGNTSLGIYELDGHTWKICLTTHGTQRPTEFAATPGTGFVLETLQRATATDEAKRALRGGCIGFVGGGPCSRTVWGVDGAIPGTRRPGDAPIDAETRQESGDGERRHRQVRADSNAESQVRSGPFTGANDNGLRAGRREAAVWNLGARGQAVDGLFWSARPAAAERLRQFRGRRQNTYGVDLGRRVSAPARAYRYPCCVHLTECSHVMRT